jgi:glucose-6-phosphate 1-dehydrogenase
LVGLEKYFNEETIFYLAVPYQIAFRLIIKLANMGANKIVVEKPFVENSAQLIDLKNILRRDVDLVLVDHYLYKPMSFAIRKIFVENDECNVMVKNAESCIVYFSEAIGAEGRKYFDVTGIVRDVVENHLIEILGLIYANIIDRTKLFDQFEIFNVHDALYGQYSEYKKEMETESDTETMCLLRLENGFEPIRDTKFVVFAAKGIDKQMCEVRFGLKECVYELALSFAKSEVLASSVRKMNLVINYNPNSEMFLEVESQNGMEKVMLFSAEYVQNYMNLEHGSLKDHQILLDALLSDKKVDVVEVEEAVALLKIFEPLKGQSIDTIKYKKGLEVTKFILDSIEEFKK